MEAGATLVVYLSRKRERGGLEANSTDEVYPRQSRL